MSLQGAGMNNNEKLLSSITLESDFEKIVQMYANEIYGGNAYLVGGPWDNGKDLVIKRGHREIRQAVQISIQLKNIDGKILSDASKVARLVDEHSYPPVLYFFWNQAISEHSLDNIRTKVQREYLITLEFYDAKRIAQDITERYPQILSFLFRDIHKFNVNLEESINIQQRAFYEYLLLSKDSTNLKNAIIDANIMSNLNGHGKTINQIMENLKGVNLTLRSLNGRLQTLIHMGKITLNEKIYTLSPEEITKLENIKLRELARKNELLSIINNELSIHTTKNLASQVVNLIITAYEESLNIQLTESKFEPPKLQIFKATIMKLKLLISQNCEMSEQQTDLLARKLMELAGQNEYLSEHCSAKLCVNLLSDRKLEKYIENKNFYIYLDAPVLIPYLITIMFEDGGLFDKSIKNINLMREYINSLNNRQLIVSNEHFEETARHYYEAEKLSQFVTDELISQLGESKNVYFNVYIRWKTKQPKKKNFEDFTYAFLGLDNDDIYAGDKYNAFAQCIHNLLTTSSIHVRSNKDAVTQEFIDKIRRKFTRSLSTPRPLRAIENDIICAATLADESLHLDSKGYFSTPMLITLDRSQYVLRTIIRNENRHAEWLVYTPQRAIERLSLVGLKFSSESLKDGVLATISEEYFFKDTSNSLIDTLAIIIGDNQTSQGDIIRLATHLKRKVNEESIDHSEIHIEHYNNISYVLLFIHREFKSEFKKIIKIFSESDYQDRIVKLLLATIKGQFNDTQKEMLRLGIESLLSEVE